jgi:hypothetical protein
VSDLHAEHIIKYREHAITKIVNFHWLPLPLFPAVAVFSVMTVFISY